jgi:DNA-binding transcriptional LysR family regulator
MMSMLDIEAVAAFVLVSDLKSFTRAAAALGSTQSAVSLRIKRLEDRLGRRLLDRTPRSVKLSADGAVFLDAARTLVTAHRQALDAFGLDARRLRLGVSDHLVGADLPILLKALARADPGLGVELRVSPSRLVLEDFDGGLLDAAVVLRHDAARRDGNVLAVEPFLWVASPDFVATSPIRIATHTDACSVRALSIRALENSGIAWTETFSGGGLGTVAAAVTAGLAVAAMARRTAPVGSVDVGRRFGLPPLPQLDIVLHTHTTDARTRAALRTLASAFGGMSPPDP